MRKLRAGLRKFGKGCVGLVTHWTKKKVCITAVLVAVLAAGGIWLAKNPLGGALPTAAMPRTRTTFLTRTTLQETISVTGMVKSDSVTNVTSTGTQTVSEIRVQAGDKVVEGQVLCLLDTTDLQETLAKERTTLNDAIIEAQKSYDKAVVARDEAYEAATNAEPTVASARDAVHVTLGKFDVAKASVVPYQINYDAAIVEEQAKGAAFNEASVRHAEDLGHQEVVDAQNAYNVAVETRKAHEASLSSAKTLCDYANLEKQYTDAQMAYNTARQTLDGLQAAYKNAKDSAETAQTRLKDANKSDALDEIQKKIDNCTIVAGGPGTITTVNATVGSAPGAVPLFVIQDTSALKIAVTVDEYDVKKVTQGSRAIIKSDATGDTEISGTLSQISLTAAQDASSGTSGFGAEVTVNDTSSGLLIGMNAKVQLVLEEKVNVFAVPLDAVGTEENGQSVIYVKNGEEFTAMPVTKGMATDYLVEITADGLSEGMEIRTFADESVLVAEEGAGNMEGFVMGGSAGGTTTVVMPAAGMSGGPGGGGRG